MGVGGVERVVVECGGWREVLKVERGFKSGERFQKWSKNLNGYNVGGTT